MQDFMNSLQYFYYWYEKENPEEHLDQDQRAAIEEFADWLDNHSESAWCRGDA